MTCTGYMIYGINANKVIDCELESGHSGKCYSKSENHKFDPDYKDGIKLSDYNDGK